MNIKTGTILLGMRLLSVCWKEFTETIIRPGKDSDRQIIFNTPHRPKSTVTGVANPMEVIVLAE